MKKLLYIKFACMACGMILWSHVSSGQYFLTPAGGNSGIITKIDVNGQANSLNYSLSSTRFGLNFARVRLDTIPLGKNSGGSERIQNSTVSNFNVGTSISQGSGSVFGSGKFSPAADGAFDLVRFLENHLPDGGDKGGYTALFLRLKFALAQNKFATSEGTSNNLITLGTKTGVTYGIGAGMNRMAKDEESWVFGLSGIYTYDKNGPNGTKKKQVSIQSFQGTDKDGNPVYVNKTEDRYYNSLVDIGKAQFRVDGVFKLGYVKGDRDNPMIGFLTSLSSDLRRDKDAAVNFALGPSLNVSKQITQTIGALLFEFTDIGNALGESPTFKEKFSVNLYVGIPFTFLE